MGSIRAFLPLVPLLLTLAACGGGDSAGSSSGSGSNGGAGAGGSSGSTPSYAHATFGNTALSLTTVNGRGGAQGTLNFSYANFTGTMWYRFRQTNTLVKSISLRHNDPNGTLSGTGTVTIDMFEGERLGAGTYTTTLSFDLCTDELCTNVFYGTPVQITITYEVTGDALPKTRVRWGASQPYAELEYDTFNAQAPDYEIRGTLDNSPVLGSLYIRRGVSQTGLVTAADFVESALPTSEPDFAFHVKLKTPASLGSGIFRDKVTFRVCLDSACSAEVQGSPFDMNVVVIVLAGEGAQIVRASVEPAFGAKAVAWSATTRQLYVSGITSTQEPESWQVQIQSIDPSTLKSSGSISLNSRSLALLATAGDGNGLFAGVFGAPDIYHLQLPALANDYSLTLEAPSSIFDQNIDSMLPLSGQPQSVLVSRPNPKTGPLLAVYDGSTVRPMTVAGNPQGERAFVVAGASPDTFYASRASSIFVGSTSWLDKLLVSSTGVTRVSSVAVPYQASPLQFANGLLYDLSARAFDPVTGSMLRSLSLTDGFMLRDFVVDGAHNRLFAEVWRAPYYERPYLMSFALDTYQLLAIAKLFNVGEYGLPGATGGAHMALWGNDGMAVTDGSRLVLLSGTFFTTYAGAP